MVTHPCAIATRTHWDELDDAIKYASPFLEVTEEEEELDFTYYEAWERSMFPLARGVLGIDYFRKALYQMWWNEIEPTPQEQKLIEDIVQRWLKFHFGPDYKKVSNTLYVKSGIGGLKCSHIYDFFKRRLWKVRNPVKRGAKFEKAYHDAVIDFLGKVPGDRVRRIIVDQDIKANHCRFVVFLICKFHDQCEDGIFPISQKRVTEYVNKLISEHPELFKTDSTNLSAINRFISLLKQEDVIEQIDTYAIGRKASSYRLSSRYQ